MAIDLLRRLSASPLPAQFYTAEEVDKVKLLRAAGLVIALTPPQASTSGATGTVESAQVLAITATGREELARFDLPGRALGRGAPPPSSWKARLGAALSSRFLQ